MSSIIKSSLIERFITLIYRLTEPDTHITESDQRLSARLLAGMMLALVMSIVMIVFTELVILEVRNVQVVMQVALSVPLLLGLYAISRTRHYLLTARLLIIQILIVPTLLIIQNDGAFYTVGLPYLTLAVLVSSLVFSIGFTLGVALLVTIITTAVTLYYHIPGAMDISVIYLNVILSGLLTLITLIRDQHQKVIAQQAAIFINEHNLLHTVIETIPASIYVKDRNSRFVMVNHRVTEAFKQPMEAIIGKSDADFFDADFAQQNRLAEQELMETGMPLTDHESQNPLRNYEWVMVTKVPLYDQAGRIIGLVGINRSINKRKQAEIALERERQLLRTVLESMPDAIYVKDLESRFTLVNQQVLDWHNLSSPDDIIGKSDRELLDEAHWEITRADELEVIASGQTSQQEYLGYSHTLNHKRWLSTVKVPLYDSNHQIVGIVGINRDITAQKQSELALIEERNLLRTLIDVMPDAIYVKDRESRFMLVNQFVIKNNDIENEASIVGKTDKDILGDDVWDLTRAEDLKVMVEGQQITNLERTWVNKHGRRVWWLITKVPIYNHNGECIGLVGIDRNINERKQMELVLLDERNLLRSVIENVPDQIYIKDRESRFMLVNDPLLQRHDLASINDVISKTDVELFPHNPRMAENYIQQEKKIFETGEPVINYEISYVKHGRQYWNLVNKVALRDREGQIIGLIGINRDITERKYIEEVLRSERNLLQNILENIPDPIYVKDRESRFLLVNQVILQGMGLNSLDDIVGKTDFDFIEAAEAQPYYEAEQELMRTGQSVINQETSGLDFQSSDDSFLVTKVPLRDPDGEIIGLVGVNRNIKERKQMENDLARERSLLQTLIETIPDSIYVKDSAGRFILANPTCWRNEGLSSMEEMVGKTDFDFFDAAQARVFQAEEQHIIATGQPVINRISRNTDAEGNIMFLVVTKVPLYDARGDLVGLIGINRDMSETIRAEIQMSYQDTLIENISDAVIFTDSDFRIRGWNLGAEKLYGWKAEEVIGQPISAVIPVMSTEQSALSIREAFMKNGYWKGEVIHPRKDDSTVDIFSSLSLVYGRDGTPLGTIGINHDITPQKVAEKQRVELAVERERVDILRRFIGDMSHDLRNPLATIKVSLYLLRRLLDNPRRRLYHLDTLDSQVNRLENMVNDLLSMANLDSESSAFNFAEANISQLVFEVVQHQEALAARREQKLGFEAEEDLLLIRCDENMLIRAITNLIANALNYTPVGGEVRVQVFQQGAAVHISVRDNGIGIDPEDLPHIFERFYRADKARSTDTGGTGLGLSITQRIVEAHEGEIVVTSEPGAGSTFTIILPAPMPSKTHS